MAGKNTAVFGIYKSDELAERAVDTLIAAGYASSDISVLLPDTRSTKEFAHEKATKAPEGTAAGVTTGGVIGGTLGVLAGVGALAIPGIGPFIAAGPIMAGIAHTASPVPPLVTVEMVERSLPAAWKWPSVSVMRIVTVIDMAVKVGWPVEPGASPDEYTA